MGEYLCPCPSTEPCGSKLDKVYQLNELNTEYDKLVFQKDEILEKENRSAITIRANKNVQDRIKFYREHLQKIKISVYVSHIILAIVIIIIMVYKLA